MKKGEIMKIICLALIAFCLSLPVKTHAHEAHDAKKGVFTKHFNGSLFKISEKGLFSIEILMDEKEYKIGKDVIGIIIHDNNDNDVEGASVTITALPPQVQIKSPFVKEKGGGLYIVSNLDLKKEDKWELRIQVKKKKSEDIVIFIFHDAVMDIKPAGKYKF
jgi:hypothetical protein